jgi:hypothetical protein
VSIRTDKWNVKLIDDMILHFNRLEVGVTRSIHVIFCFLEAVSEPAETKNGGGEAKPHSFSGLICLVPRQNRLR